MGRDAALEEVIADVALSLSMLMRLLTNGKGRIKLDSSGTR